MRVAVGCGKFVPTLNPIIKLKRGKRITNGKNFKLAVLRNELREDSLPILKF
jgi:hypothetical protein